MNDYKVYYSVRDNKGRKLQNVRQVFEDTPQEAVQRVVNSVDGWLIDIQVAKGNTQDYKTLNEILQ